MPMMIGRDNLQVSMNHLMTRGSRQHEHSPYDHQCPKSTSGTSNLGGGLVGNGKVCPESRFITILGFKVSNDIQRP
jgi:hypothetical protein